MTIDEKIDLMTAFRDGAATQFRSRRRAGEPWVDCESPEWNFEDFEYRIRPEPRKPREFWISEFSGRAYAAPFDLEHPGNLAVHVREVLEEDAK